MTDPVDFSSRFDLALALCGKTNAVIAAALENGQQNIYNWRKRGSIPAEGFRKIRHLLPGVSFEWLNDGIGSPPQPAKVYEPPGDYEADPSAAIERLKSDIQSLQQVIGFLTTALAQNVPDAIERVVVALRNNGLPNDRNFLNDYLELADTALALRRETVGPKPAEPIATSGAAPRP